MWLTNIPKIRIRQSFYGWVVEVQKSKWYGKKYWVHIISVTGVPKEPYYFRTYSSALTESVKLFRWYLMDNAETT